MSMGKKGYNQGDMKPTVEEYQKPMKDFSQENMGKTTEYISRQDRIQSGEAREIKGQAYKGRYS